MSIPCTLKDQTTRFPTARECRYSKESELTSSTSTIVRPFRILCLDGLEQNVRNDCVTVHLWNRTDVSWSCTRYLGSYGSLVFFYRVNTDSVWGTNDRPPYFHHVESRLHVAVKLEPNVSTDARRTRTLGLRNGTHACQSIGQADVRSVQGCATQEEGLHRLQGQPQAQATAGLPHFRH